MLQLSLSEQLPRPGGAEVEAVTRLHSPAHPPVFLHCGWRTRGTWIWNHFRALDGVTGYYEPLTETLASLQPRTLASFNAGSWPSGHQGMDRPYFDEFRPFLRRTGWGVQGYRTRFVTDGFFAGATDTVPGLEPYLLNLLHGAQACGNQPVLKFCRSIGRVGWMQSHFPGSVHIAVLRNPFSQFESAARQFVLHGTAYFLSMPLLLLALHRDLPAVSACLRYLGAELPLLDRRASLKGGLAACEASIRRSEPAVWYRAFLAFWVLTATSIPDTVDLVINSDLMASSRQYRRRCQFDLAELTGQTVDFGDVSDPADQVRPTCVLAGLDDVTLQRTDILRANRAAEAFLAEQAGIGWAGGSVPAQLETLLAEASLRALDALPPQPPSFGRIAVPGDDDAYSDAVLRTTMQRAARAEQKLAEVYASRSWRLTGPLRVLRRTLRRAAAAYGSASPGP